MTITHIHIHHAKSDDYGVPGMKKGVRKAPELAGSTIRRPGGAATQAQLRPTMPSKHKGMYEGLKSAGLSHEEAVHWMKTNKGIAYKG